MKTFCVSLFGLVALCGCALMAPAPSQNVFSEFRAGCIQAWGPENTWTPRQEAIFQDGLNRLLAANMDAPSSYPAYQPPAPTLPSYQVTRYGNQGTTSTVTRDSRGNYTIWNSDGTTASAVSDGRGGYTIWR